MTDQTSENPLVRLGDTGSPGRRGLLSLIEKPVHPNVQKEALRRAGGPGSPEALEGLGRIVEAGRSEQGELAVRLLMRTALNEAVAALSRGLSSGDPAWRLWILKNLADRPEPEAVVVILDASRDPDPRVRGAAARLLELVAVDHQRMDAPGFQDQAGDSGGGERVSRCQGESVRKDALDTGIGAT